MIGTQFGYYTVSSLAKRTKKHVFWNCKCACGNERIVREDTLKKGTSKSCGCLRDKLVVESATTHGQSKTRTFAAWIALHDRCSRKVKGYENIRVCKEWSSFEKFHTDMGSAPSEDHEIDRIDYNGDYKKSNCRWATNKQQARNRRTNRIITWKNKSQCVAAWAEEMSISRRVLSKRLNCGWEIEKALTYPLDARKSRKTGGST